MALDKTFSSGEILSAGDVNGHLLGLWIPIDKRVIASGSPTTVQTFSSLDSNFRFFRLTYHVVATVGLWVRFNNDSGSNYTQQLYGANNNTFVSGRLTPSIALDMMVGVNNCPNQGQLLVSKLSTTAELRGMGHVTVNPHATLIASSFGVSWNNTASLLNRIDLIANSGNYYGVVALEGMRGV